MSEERLQMIKSMLENNPDDSFLNYAAALEYNKRGLTDKAIEVLESIIVKDPDYVGTYYQLGKFYESKGEMERAIDVYKAGKIVANAQGDRKILNELAEALMMIEDED